MAVSKPLDVSKVSKVMDAGLQGKRGGWRVDGGWGVRGEGEREGGRREEGKGGSEGILHRRRK